MKILIPILFILSLAFTQPACVTTQTVSVIVCDTNSMLLYFSECIEETIKDTDSTFIRRLKTKDCRTTAKELWCKKQKMTIRTRRGRVIETIYLPTKP